MFTFTTSPDSLTEYVMIDNSLFYVSGAPVTDYAELVNGYNAYRALVG